MKFTISPLALLLALAAPAALAAEDVYQSTMPDGKVVYSDTPQPGAKSVRKVPPPAVSGATIVTPNEKERARTATTQEGGIAVIPLRDRPLNQPAQQGTLQGGNELPKRSY